nr:MAG TPA: zinc-ribbon containing domain protein [Caudoviricetes sp.]
MMADFIRREDALFALRKAERGGSMTALTRLERAYAEIREMPAADVAEVVHAKWIPFHSEAAGDIQYCSACDIGFDARMDYCPHCGARMDGWMEDADNG